MKPVDAFSTTPPLAVLPTTKPERWGNHSLEWLTDTAPVFVHLGVVSASTNERDFVVLGARYDCATAQFNGQPWNDGGHFVEYFIAEEKAPHTWKVHRLLQRNSITYTDSDQQWNDFVPARSVKDAAARSVVSVPQWKPSEAHWPTLDGVPMIFLGQLALHDSAVARTLFTWGTNVYVFSALSGNGRVFKIIAQEAKFQTAEEHYADEERRAKRLARKQRDG